MRFLFPGFLFALLTVAIPIIIHLFNFRKFKKVYFSNVQFLKEIEQQTSSSKNLRNLLVLASRILAIIFLVFAFAQPYFPAKNNASAYNSQIVSVFIDNSYSMETVSKQGSLLDEAKRRAKEIAAAYNLNDKFQVINNDFEGRHQRLLNLDEFNNAVDEIKISPNNRTISDIIERQKDIFDGNPNSLKTSYVISDFQKNMLSQTDLPGDSSVKFRLLRLKSNTLPNISIDSVWFTSPIHRTGQAEKLVVKLRNNSDVKSENIPIKLLINKQQKAIGSIRLEPRASSSDTLSFSSSTAGWQGAEINITDYPVIFDDRFYFSYHVQESLKILAINGVKFNPFLQAVYQSDPFFRLENVSSGNINYSNLGNYPLIILNEISEFSSGLIQQLKIYAERGGSIIVFPALNSDFVQLSNFLNTLGTDIPEQIIDSETRVASINLSHLVFKDVFERLPQKMDLPAVKKYIRFSSRSRSGRQTILELPGKRVFMGEYALGKGKIYISAVPLQDEAGNFARHSVFVPLMYRVALLGLQDSRLFYTIGKDQSIEIPRLNLNANQTLRIKNKEFEAIPDVRQTENATRLFIADQIKDAGNYEITKGDSVMVNISFNNSGSESDLTYASDGDLRKQFDGNKPDILNSAEGSIQNQVKTANLGTQLWKLCLILSLICLAAEILLIRFYTTTSTHPVINYEKNSPSTRNYPG
ncbi:BatA domain-containing protein [Daejeonella oryzae]|uniref:BatA domain-containing protein n=1 Tax=Daejeonella oryzae TaxID=1122943 RepID=UPI000425F7B9|nr:BatA domain-containing protein [Daejeonella oryzae]